MGFSLKNGEPEAEEDLSPDSVPNKGLQSPWVWICRAELVMDTHWASDEAALESFQRGSLRGKWWQAHRKITLKKGYNMGPESTQEMEPDTGLETSYCVHARSPRGKQATSSICLICIRETKPETSTVGHYGLLVPSETWKGPPSTKACSI